MKSLRSSILILISVYGFSCNNIQETIPYPEPADPDSYDLTVWQDVKQGLHSGFGSIDVTYSKSIPPKGDISESIQLQGWKGERVACKLLVWSSGNEENIIIKSSNFKNDKHEIDQEAISISMIRYVLTDEFHNESGGTCGPRDNDKTPVHLSPDLLSGRNNFTFEEKGTRPFWISIDIPADAQAGMYSGEIRIKSRSGNIKHNISLEVMDKLLPPPSEWSFHLDLWQNPFAIARFHEVELWSEEHVDLLRPYLTMLAEAGQKCITAILIEKPWDGGPCYDPFHSMVNWTKKKDGSWEYDYSIFDKYVSLAMECGIKKQINCYSMVPLTNSFTYFDEAVNDTLVSQYIPGTTEYEVHWTGFILDFKKHLKEKGWLDITTIALDEREQDEMAAMFSFLARVAPEFRIAMAGFYYPDINSSIYDFCSNWRDYGRIPTDSIPKRKAAGQITTYYVACGIPTPNNFTFSPPAESCVEGWIASAMGFDGFLRWAYNSWPENPLIDSRYIKWPAGDTYFIYPGPLSSVRFERLREGIQDYEKIRIIKNDLESSASNESAEALLKLNQYLSTIDAKTLYEKTAGEVINEGKQLIYKIVKTGN